MTDEGLDWVGQWYAENLHKFPDIEFGAECDWCGPDSAIIVHDSGERECYWCGGLQ